MTESVGQHGYRQPEESRGDAAQRGQSGGVPKNPLAWLRAVHEAATPGTWSVDAPVAGKSKFIRRWVWLQSSNDDDIADLGSGEQPRVDNARAIALAHNVLPELLAVAEAARSLRTFRHDVLGPDVAFYQCKKHVEHLEDLTVALNARIRELREAEGG